jgi:lipoprotein-releasing system permease protein
VISGFQWFVAWRYLMAKPRKVSTSILIVASALAVTALGCLAVAYLVLDDPAPIDGLPVFNPLRANLLRVAAGSAALLELTVLLGLVRYFFTFFTAVSIGGVGIGTMALVIVLSVMAGFESDLRDKILGSNAHLRITRREGAFTEYAEVRDRLKRVPDVVASTPYLVSEVVIGASANYYNVVIKGIDPETVAAVTDLRDDLDEDESLARLWPLSPEGATLGRTPHTDDDTPAEPVERGAVDPAPDDFDLELDEPIDLSGTEASDGRAGAGDAESVVDLAPDDLNLGEDAPIDFSGEALPALPEIGADDFGGDDDPGSIEDDDEFEQFDEYDRARREAHRLLQDGGLVYGPGLEEDLGEPAREFSGQWPEEMSGRAFAGARRRAASSQRVNVLDGVLVGRELVRNMHLYVGQEVSLVSPFGLMTPAGPAPRSKPYRIAGTFYTGMYEYDTKFIYVEYTSLQRFLSMGDEVSGVEVRVRNRDRTEGVKAAITGALGPDYLVEDWKEINRSLFAALELEKLAMFLVLAIIILVASFSIIGNLIMIVVEKGREIAVLKTLGASHRGVMKIFWVQGFFIGVVGTTLGVSNGLLACWIGITWGLPLDPDVYYIDRLPIAVEWLSVSQVALAGMLISVLATLYPAYLSARVLPVEGLRYE